MSKLPHPASSRNHSAMQPWTIEFVPPHFPLPSTSYMYTSNLQLYRSVARDNYLWPDPMAPSGKSWQPPSPLWGRRRAPSNSQDSQQTDTSTEPPRQLRRSVSAASPPVTPTQSGALADSGARLQSPPAGHIRRRPTRLSSLIRRHHTADSSYVPSPEQNPKYIAYSPNPSSSFPQSAPSAITSFPAAAAAPTITTQVTQQPSVISPSVHDVPRSDFVSTTAQYRSAVADPWQSAIISPLAFRTTDPSFTDSPVSFISPSSPPPSVTRTDGLRGFTSSSDPGRMARSVSTSALPERRDSESAADAFESPMDFALFAEATSSLGIGGITDAPFVREPTPTGRVTPGRLDAPLPPVPQEDVAQVGPTTTSVSSQARAQSLPPRQTEPQVLTIRPSRTQLAAEALLGLHDSSDLAGSDDELPDYAQSQMEATARQRWEATQRARELDEAWRRGRRSRGA